MNSPLLTKERASEIFDKVQRAARASGVTDVEVSMHAVDDSLTRFANNQIHQNVAERDSSLSVRTIIDHRHARATTNRFDEASLQAVVAQAIALTRSSEPDPAALPLYVDSSILDGCRYSPAAAECTARQRAETVRDAIGVAQSAGQTAAGIYSTGEAVDLIANSAGLFRYHVETHVQFSITSMAPGSSGWAKLTSPFFEGVDPLSLARRAVEKARGSPVPKDIEPGEYTVILEPAAVLDLAGQIFHDFGATALEEKRSFLNDRIDTRIFGENIHIHDNVASPLQAGPPFDGEGVPRQQLNLVEGGIPRQVAISRASAARIGTQPTGHGFSLPNEHGEWPINIVVAGGNSTVDDLIASTRRGLLVTRLWYIREVEPYDKVMTGMTRDGTFLIIDGEIAHGVKNLRFNQSVVELLNNVEAMSEAVRASGEEAFDMVVPAMKVNAFRFTEQTRY